LKSKVVSDIKELDPSVSVNNVYETEVVEEKTEKKYTKEELKKMKESVPEIPIFEGTLEALEDLTIQKKAEEQIKTEVSNDKSVEL
jgi:benzoyl-CoA reductase/2-hydroxyglutaryl-CoA dehydratase subunit BcrC/BadD/HgdB